MRRAPLTEGVELSTADKNGDQCVAQRAAARDCSTGGAALILHDEAPFEERTDISLKFESGPLEGVELSAEIIRIESTDGETRLGLEWIELSEDNARQIREHVAAQADAGAEELPDLEQRPNCSCPCGEDAIIPPDNPVDEAPGTTEPVEPN